MEALARSNAPPSRCPAVIDVQLTAQERLALKNLAGKKKGEAVDYINIADARALTEMGLAVRSQQGWTITAAGEALLNAAPDA